MHEPPCMQHQGHACGRVAYMCTSATYMHMCVPCAQVHEAWVHMHEVTGLNGPCMQCTKYSSVHVHEGL